jgi:hypothetical protein
MHSVDIIELANRIRSVFGHLRHPGVENLCSPPVIEDGEDLVAEFADQHWTQLSLQSVFYHRAGLSSLSPQGYRFYLAAFMTAALTATSEQGRADITDYTLWSLAPHDESPASLERFQQRISLLDDEEKQVVREFVAAMAARWAGWSNEAAYQYWVKR